MDGCFNVLGLTVPCALGRGGDLANAGYRMARRRKGRAISGWVIIDKPAGWTSTAVVNKVKWAFQAQRPGMQGHWIQMQRGFGRGPW